MSRLRDWLGRAGSCCAPARPRDAGARRASASSPPPRRPARRARGRSLLLGSRALRGGVRRRLRARPPAAPDAAARPRARRSRSRCSRRGARRRRQAARRRPRSSTEDYPRPEHPEEQERDRARSSTRAATRLTRKRLLERRRRGAPAARSARRSSRPPLSLGPLLDTEPLYATPWRRGRRLVDEDGRAAARRRDRGGHVLHGVPRGRRPRADRRAARRRAAAARELHLPPGARGLGAGRDRRLLEDLHARGLRDRALPQADVRGRPSRGRRSSAPATTRRSTRARAARCSSARPGGRCRSCRSSVDRDGHLRAAGDFSGPVGPSWWGVRSGSAIRDPALVRFLDERTGAAPFLRKALRYVFPDHWSFLLGEVALYCFIVLVATGVYLTLFFDPSSRDRMTYHGSYAPLRGATMTTRTGR